MRRISLAVGVLAIAISPAVAQDWAVTLREADTLQDWYNPTQQGYTFDVVVHIQAPEPMTAWGGVLEMPDGYSIAPAEVLYGTWVTNYADSDPGVLPPTNSSNWMVTIPDATAWPVGVQSGNLTSSLPPPGEYATSGFAVRFTVTAPLDWQIGDVITYRTVPAFDGDPWVISIGGLGFVDHYPSVYPLTMIPEPSSLLCILAGLPLLLRRRR
jgi:hypothetical protein